MMNDHFYQKLCYLGVKIGGIEIRNFNTEYVDLEEFFLESLSHLDDESRIRSGLLNWYCHFMEILSPSKIRRLLKQQNKNVDQEILTFVIIFLQERKIINHQWSILKSSISKKGPIKFIFIPDKKKYLKTNEYLIRTCPELSYRMKGFSPLVADIKAALSKNDFITCYQLAKVINYPRNRVYEEYGFLKKFQNSEQDSRVAGPVRGPKTGPLFLELL